MKKIIYIVLIMLISSILSQCNFNNNAEYIEQMMSRPITLQLNENETFYDLTPSKITHNSYKLVIYVDSTKCSTCLISTFYNWNNLIDSLKTHFNIDFIFIVSPRLHKLNKTKLAAKYNNLNCPIYIDSTHVFLKKNAHIPKDELYHIFLLDINDNVMVVGDPLSNKRVRELMIKRMKSMGDSELTKSAVIPPL